jgi:hypothetical protein
MVENRKIDEQRFEFLLKINNHIICQRYFHIKGFNADYKNSIELTEMAKSCVSIIEKDLIKKSRLALWETFNPYIEQDVEKIDRRPIKDDAFQFEIKIDKNTVVQAYIDGKIFPPKVRYQIDIKDIIHDVISEIRYWLTKKNYDKKYGEVEL